MRWLKSIWLGIQTVVGTIFFAWASWYGVENLCHAWWHQEIRFGRSGTWVSYGSETIKFISESIFQIISVPLMAYIAYLVATGLLAERRWFRLWKPRGEDANRESLKP